MENIIVSVITPAYNRALTLPRTFESLVAQTCYDFEWIVVDDGSTDDTRVVAEKLIETAPFKSRYFYKTNGGVHTARNLGIREAIGKYAMLLDSDDTLLPDTIAYGISAWGGVKNPEDYWCIVGRCVYENGEMVGKPFPENINTLSRTKKLRLIRKDYSIECCGFQRMDLLKELPWPEPPDVKYVAEGTVWSVLNSKYDQLYINHAFRVYFQDSGNQITRVSISSNAQMTGYLYSLHIINVIFKLDKSYYFGDKIRTLFAFTYDVIGMKKPRIEADVETKWMRMFILGSYHFIKCGMLVKKCLRKLKVIK